MSLSHFELETQALKGVVLLDARCKNVSRIGRCAFNVEMLLRMVTDEKQFCGEKLLTISLRADNARSRAIARVFASRVTNKAINSFSTQTKYKKYNIIFHFFCICHSNQLESG